MLSWDTSSMPICHIESIQHLNLACVWVYVSSQVHLASDEIFWNLVAIRIASSRMICSYRWWEITFSICALAFVSTCFLNSFSSPIRIIMLCIRSLLSLTTRVPMNFIYKHLQASVTSDDFSWSIMVVAWKIMTLGIIIVLLHTYRTGLANWQGIDSCSMCVYLPWPENSGQKTAWCYHISEAFVVHKRPYNAYKV